MKKYLLPEKKNTYKANLHMHTVLSDGDILPEDVKKGYMEKGYSIVAFSDHEVMIPHPELTDESFLALTSYEVAINDYSGRTDDYSFEKSIHMNVFAPEASMRVSPIFNEDQLWPRIEHARAYINDEMRAVKFDLGYTTEQFNKMIAACNEAGFLVCFNHPVWSSTDFTDYHDFKGLWGVECYNIGAGRSGYLDTMQPIDDLWKRGEHVFPVAADDAHAWKDAFGGFVMVRADELEYGQVFEALKKGDFYASTGPEIISLYVEDGVLHVATKDAKKIFISSERRFAMGKLAGEGEVLSGAEFDLSKYFRFDAGENGFIRVTVVDAEGNEAHTRGYSREEMI